MSKIVNPSGKRSVVFNLADGFKDMPIQVPCGQCINCRLNRSRQWAIRCVHEAAQYEDNCFVTLTYNNDNLPENGSLVLEDFQKFFKRLRKKFGSGIRFFHCGEYGERFARPHYHACIFNFDFADKRLWTVKNGFRLYTSDTLYNEMDVENSLWKYGYCIIGDVTFESAAYVARYITKKIFGDRAEAHYGERRPEYTTMSKGIGKKHIEKYWKSIYKQDHVVINSRTMKPPKYYDNFLEKENPHLHRKIKTSREIAAAKAADFGDPKRRQVKERLQILRFKRLIRSFENENDVYGL